VQVIKSEDIKEEICKDETVKDVFCGSYDIESQDIKYYVQ
jgi:hypothetical protein